MSWGFSGLSCWRMPEGLECAIIVLRFCQPTTHRPSQRTEMSFQCFDQPLDLARKHRSYIEDSFNQGMDPCLTVRQPLVPHRMFLPCLCYWTKSKQPGYVRGKSTLQSQRQRDVDKLLSDPWRSRLGLQQAWTASTRRFCTHSQMPHHVSSIVTSPCALALC